MPRCRCWWSRPASTVVRQRLRKNHAWCTAERSDPSLGSMQTQLLDLPLVTARQIGQQRLVAEIQWRGMLPVVMSHLVEPLDEVFVVDLDGEFAAVIETARRQVDRAD